MRIYAYVSGHPQEHVITSTKCTLTLDDTKLSTVKLDFHSDISLIANEIFTHEKYSDIVCRPSEPFN